MQDGTKENLYCWSIVGNIVENHKFGEQHEIRNGTKHFRPGAKVYIAPIQWGDGGEDVVVIGLPRHSKKLIEVVMRSDYITNFRVKRVYSPAVLQKMQTSQYRWWGAAENDRIQILQHAVFRHDPTREKAVSKRPQSFGTCNDKNHFSADMPRAKRRAF